MSETKFTPGPWEATRISTSEIEIGAETPEGHLSVAWVHLGEQPTEAEAAAGLADAKAIEAMPALYEALVLAREPLKLALGHVECAVEIDRPCNCGAVEWNAQAQAAVDAIDAALSLARGEESDHA